MAGLILTDAIDSSSSFVGIATNFGLKHGELIGGHSAILIRYKEINYTFHFTGREVLLQNIDDDTFNKAFKYVNGQLDVVAKGETEVAAFLGRCKFLQKKAKPQFGYIFDETHYNPATGRLNTNDSPDFCTCVGFCLKVINGVLKVKSIESFLDVKSWETISIEHPEYLNNVNYLLQNNPELKIDSIAPFHKRIRPCEFLVTTLNDSKKYPITRDQVLEKYNETMTEIESILKLK